MAMQSGFIKRIRDIMRMDAGINGDAQRIEQMVWMLFLKVYDAKEQDWQWEDEEYVKIEKIIGAVRELISYAELMWKERQE